MLINVHTYHVKYSYIEYSDKYVTVYQGKFRKRIPRKYCYDDDGEKIWLTYFAASCFRHGQKDREYVLDTETGEYQNAIEVHLHVPGYIPAVEDNTIENLAR